MPEAIPASGEGGAPTPSGRSGVGDAEGLTPSRLADQARAIAARLSDALGGLPEPERRRAADAVAAALEGFGAAVADMVRGAVGPPPGAGLSAPPEVPPGVGGGGRIPTVGWSVAPTGGTWTEDRAAPAAAEVGTPRPGAAEGTAEGTSGVETGAGTATGPTEADTLADLAARLLAEARVRRGAPEDAGRVVPDDTQLRMPPPHVSVVPFSAEGERAEPPGGEAGEPVGVGEGQGGAAGAPGGDPVAAALGWSAEAGRRVVVGFADVVGVADPGTATRLLQSRVLGALVPGDVGVMAGAGEAVFVLSDADLVEADRRFRHLGAPTAAGAPAVRLGFVVPRSGEAAEDVVRRARTAATGRWARAQTGHPV